MVIHLRYPMGIAKLAYTSTSQCQNPTLARLTPNNGAA